MKTFIKQFSRHLAKIALFFSWITANAITRFVKQNIIVFYKQIYLFIYAKYFKTFHKTLMLFTLLIIGQSKVFAQMRITEFSYSAVNGEFIEFTNIGNVAIDMTNWSFDDNTRNAGSQSLSSFGSVKPGESVILTETLVTTFRANWNLCSELKIIGGMTTNNLGRSDEINLYNSTGVLVDSLTFDDQTLGGPRTLNASAWVNATGIGVNNSTLWTLSSVGDAEGSVKSAGGDIGSPGISKRASVLYTPCTLIIAIDLVSTSNYIDGGIETSPNNHFSVSGVVDDPTDPAKTLGIDFTISNNVTQVNLSSSNIVVVPIENLKMTGTGISRKLTITPAGVGYSTITINVNNGTNYNSFVLYYAASAASVVPNTTRYFTGTSDASTAVAIDANHMLVGDDENQIIRLYNRQNSGLPINGFDYSTSLGLTDINNGVPREVDIEASVQVGNRIYWLGSHGNGSDGGIKVNRSRLFATDLSGTGALTTLTYVGRYDKLKADLLAWDAGNVHGLGANFLGLTASSTSGIPPESPSGDGFNIEGLAMAPNNLTAYICFRAPISPASARVKALIIPVTNFTSLVNGNPSSGPAIFGSPILFDLGGLGIREIKKNSNNEYLIIAGPHDGTSNFKLFTWTGDSSDSPHLLGTDLNSLLLAGGSFEAILDVPNPITNTDEIQLLVDAGDIKYYDNIIEAKLLPNTNHKKFRSEIVKAENLPIIYVKANATGANNGSSWVDAFTNLQSAIEYKYYDSIWVSAGTYKPTKDPFGNTSPTDPRDKTFYLQNTKKLYGGFSGNETSFNQRTPEVIAANPSILSGDIGVANDSTDNVYHVVLSVNDNSSTILDGFTITKGNAIWNMTESSINVESQDISRAWGGGMINGFSSPIISNCIFLANSASWVGGGTRVSSLGGGISNISSSPTITNCSFIANNSAWAGGGIWNVSSSPAISNCSFFANNAASAGGGINNNNSTPTITNCKFYNNKAAFGAGLINYGSSSIISNCSFFGNIAQSFGGGMTNENSNQPIITNCSFSENFADGGAGMYNTDTSPLVTNCTFSKNTAVFGGGMLIFYSSPIIKNCTFSNNSVTLYGGGIDISSYSNPIIKNSIFWGNKKNTVTEVLGADIEVRSNAAATLTYSALQMTNNTANYPSNGFQGNGLGNIYGKDPLFINEADPDGTDNTFGNADDGLALQQCSPAINTGNNAGLTATTDITGAVRVQNSTVDMGAYESAVGCPIPKNSNVTEVVYTEPQTGNLRAYSSNCSQIVLQWDDHQGRNEESYELYRSINTPDGPYIAIGQPHANETQWIDKNLNSNTLYYYIIRARFGDGFSEFSPVAYANTSGINLKIASNCATKVALEWDICSTQHEGWIIKASTDNINYFDIGRADALVGNFEAIQLKPATKYYFVVQPIYNNGFSNWSNVVVVTLPSFPAPSNLKSIYSSGKVTLTWSDNANGCDNEENFVVMKKNLSGVYEDYAVVDNDKPIFTDTNVLQNIDNCYLVKARNFHGFVNSLNNSCISANVSVVNSNQKENINEQGKIAANEIVNDQSGRKINKDIDTENEALKSLLQFYPNPVINQLNIRAIALIKGKVEITIYDIKGTIKLQKTVTDFDENNESIFDTSHLQPGIYIIKYAYKNNVKVLYGKLIKMN